MILLTGAAGFIGFHVAQILLAQGEEVLGVDDLNAYYEPALKAARLDILRRAPGFRFAALDIADHGALRAAAPPEALTRIVHLAAQAGVRYSLEAPFAYERSNTAGHLSVLELARAAPRLAHLVYASSSSVYGDRTGGPFRETDRCDAPASLYAATKRACELMSETYARLFGLKQTGLRFFTVYGPWGRPDMAYWMFTEKVIRGEALTLYDGGAVARDFTAIEDIAPAVAAILARPPEGEPPHALYNLGNSRPTPVSELVDAIEQAVGRPAIRRSAPRLKTEVAITFADHSAATARFGFAPQTRLASAIPRFVAWYRDHYRV